MKMLLAGMVAMVSLVLVLGANQAGEKDKKAEPKFKIKEVMAKAHGEEGLLEKVTEGTATAKEKKLLVEMYAALHANTPPKGDQAKWAKVTQSMVDGAKAVDDGTDEKGKALAKLVNCKACHAEFKAPKKK
jgi:hypothetical protein